MLTQPHKQKPMFTFITVWCLLFIFCSCANNEEIVRLAKPTPAQAAWQDMELGMFIHFGIETWQDKETDDAPVM